MEDLFDIACNPVVMVMGYGEDDPLGCLVYRPDEFRVLLRFIESTNIVIYGRTGK